jgi:threonine/homoserine/homoserine lactone efflux protein
LPPFIDDQLPMPAQLSVLVLLVLIIEFVALLSYAIGGQTLNRVLQKNSNVRVLNRISGSLMILVGVWLALG